MKNFVKVTLAVMCGIFIMNIIGVIVLLMFMGSAISAVGSSAPVLPRNGVLKMDMSKISIVEQPVPSVDMKTALKGGSTVTPVGIWNAVQAIEYAAADPGVKFIYLKPDGISADIAAIEELRAALAEFRKSGKAVVSYMSEPTTASYYLASVSDKVFMSSASGATPMITGIGGQMFFLKDLLGKFGVNVQLIRHGKYKSAGEMYIKNAPSPENLEQNREMIGSIWNSIAGEVAESRGISADDFSAMIDGLKLEDASDMLENSLVDEVLSRNEMRERIAALAVEDDFSDVAMISFPDYVSVNGNGNLTSKRKIAVVYADGNIVDGESSSNVAGDTFSSILASIRKDDDIEAVVLRVASPGGSVIASDKIKNEIDLLRAEKPVIASYGSYAASGGYWISNSCDRIFTDKTTLTGSIGCFSMIPDLSKTASDFLHVGVTTVGSSPHTDMYSLMRPLDKAETEYMQSSIETIYGNFVSIVAQGRELTPEFVDSIAQGRVWTGADALDLGLVDSIGTLKDAVQYAAVTVGEPDLSQWTVVSYPRPQSVLDAIMTAVGQKLDGGKDVLAGTPFAGVEKAFKDWTWEGSNHIYARMPYDIVIK